MLVSVKQYNILWSAFPSNSWVFVIFGFTL